MATSAEFLRGTSDGVFVSLEGRLSPGPTLTNRVSSSSQQVWSGVETADGTLWAGTGGDGRVLRLRPGQVAEETVLDTEESHVFAMAAGGGRVFAASSPDGRIYRVDTAAPTVVFDPPEKYIWALAVDGAGRIWVGAGSPAVIHRVDADGTAHLVHRPPAAHVVALLADATGRMMAATDSPGRLYRFAQDGRPFVMLEPGTSELRGLAVDGSGAVFAAGVGRPGEASGESALLATTEAPPAPGSPPATTARRSTIFRIDPSGTWESIWETTDVVYDLAAGADGLVVATGPEGRLYRVTRNRDVHLLTGVDARHITRFLSLPRPGQTFGTFATAAPGRVVSPAAAPSTGAVTYTSPVRDSKSVATWGLIRWEATDGVSLSTRSGNTERPDDSWSDWAGPYVQRAGEPIKSPPARFVQWRATFGRPTATLTSVTLAYLPRNSRPIVSSVVLQPPGVVFQRPFAGDDTAIAGLDDAVADARRPAGDAGPPPAAPGKRMFQKGLQTVQWKGEDADGDRLGYAVHYRRVGDSTWRLLRSGLPDGIFVWDTTTVADGHYVLRITATDGQANSADRALTAERETERVDVDNAPPVVTVDATSTAAGLRLVVRVRDAQSPIQRLEYSVAGGPWQLVFPADGLSDSPDERYDITLPAGTDAATVVVRATDLLHNVSAVPAAAR
jgi:hypothetical protein